MRQISSSFVQINQDHNDPVLNQVSLCVQNISQSSYKRCPNAKSVYGSISVAGVFPVNLLFATNLWEFVDELWERAEQLGGF